MAFAHVTLATRDVAATARFFESAFGWKPVDRPNNIPLQAAWLRIAPGQELHILNIPDFQPSRFEAEFGRHFALFHPASDFPTLKERIAQAGGQFIDPMRDTPFERFFFKDPNGYVFEIIDDRQNPVRPAGVSPVDSDAR